VASSRAGYEQHADDCHDAPDEKNGEQRDPELKARRAAARVGPLRPLAGGFFRLRKHLFPSAVLPDLDVH